MILYGNILNSAVVVTGCRLDGGNSRKIRQSGAFLFRSIHHNQVPSQMDQALMDLHRSRSLVIYINSIGDNPRAHSLNPPRFIVLLPLLLATADISWSSRFSTLYDQKMMFVAFLQLYTVYFHQQFPGSHCQLLCLSITHNSPQHPHLC